MSGSFRRLRSLRFRRQNRDSGEDDDDGILLGVDEKKTPNKAVSATHAGQPMSMQQSADVASQAPTAGYGHGHQTAGALPFIPRDASASMQPSLFNNIVKDDHPVPFGISSYYPNPGALPAPGYPVDQPSYSYYDPPHSPTSNLGAPPIQSSGTTPVGAATSDNRYQGFDAPPYSSGFSGDSIMNHRFENDTSPTLGVWASTSIQSSADKTPSSYIGTPAHTDAKEKQLGLVYGDKWPSSYSPGSSTIYKEAESKASRRQGAMQMMSKYSLREPRKHHSTKDTMQSTDQQGASNQDSPEQGAPIAEDIRLLREFTKSLGPLRCRCNTKMVLGPEYVIKMTRHWASNRNGKRMRLFQHRLCRNYLEN